VQIRATRAQPRAVVVARGDAGSARALRRELDQPELDVVDRERLLGESVKPAHDLGRKPGLRGRTRDRKRAGATRDRDVERRLDLAQIRIERPAEVRERAIVERRQRKLFPLASIRHSPTAPRSAPRLSPGPPSPLLI